MMNRRARRYQLQYQLLGMLVASVLTSTAQAHEQSAGGGGEKRWLAGDHHIHSRYSVGWDYADNPPSPIIGGDAIYPIAMNALMAKHYGLDWMVATDHGGPNHSKINLEHAYPELQRARELIPDVIQFFGMEFDTPGADHSSLIMPHSHDEAVHLHHLESRFNKREPWPVDKAWDTEARMIEALQAMQTLPEPPVVIAHHPSRSSQARGEYGLTSPAELRAWNDAAPDIAIGMEGAPGHQAIAQMRQGPAPTLYDKHFGDQRPRGAYRGFPTMGGFDQMTAIVGGFWDSMLGEGRRWWITANSDSHVHWSEGGADFWPGEYSKTYVLAEKTHDSILTAIRSGRVFVTTGDLVSEMWVVASAGKEHAGMGGTLTVAAGTDIKVSIRFLDPDKANFNGDNPTVKRVDLIAGEVSGNAPEATTDINPTTRVIARFTPRQWRVDGKYRVIEHTLSAVESPLYIRVRGTSTEELEPEPDGDREDAWRDLWFYANPIFVELGVAN